MLQLHRSSDRHVADITDSFITNKVLLLQVPSPIISLVMSSKKVCCPLNLSLEESVLCDERSAHVMNVSSSPLSFPPFLRAPFPPPASLS